MRWEYSEGPHLFSIIPIVQQIVGIATVASSIARATNHAAQLAFNHLQEAFCLIEKSYAAQQRNSLKEQLALDKECFWLGIVRIIPLYGSIVSLIIVTGLDTDDGGPIFERLSLLQQRERLRA